MPNITDQAMATELGLSIPELLTLPGASEYRRKGRGGRWVWSDDAATAIRAQLAPGLADAPDPDPQPSGENDAPPPAILTVASRPLPNRSLLACVGAGANAQDRTQWILVKVRDNTLFMPGMQVQAEQVPGASCWRYRGRGDKQEHQTRYPRSRGRW